MYSPEKKPLTHLISLNDIILEQYLFKIKNSTEKNNFLREKTQIKATLINKRKVR